MVGAVGGIGGGWWVVEQEAVEEGAKLGSSSTCM